LSHGQDDEKTPDSDVRSARLSARNAASKRSKRRERALEMLAHREESEKHSEERAHTLSDDDDSSSSTALVPVEVLDPERGPSLRDQGEPEELTSALASALRANGSPLDDEKLNIESDAAIRRALAKLPAGSVANLIAKLGADGAQYPSALDKVFPQ